MGSDNDEKHRTFISANHVITQNKNNFVYALSGHPHIKFTRGLTNAVNAKLRIVKKLTNI
jgi:hypothetical protein